MIPIDFYFYSKTHHPFPFVFEPLISFASHSLKNSLCFSLDSGDFLVANWIFFFLICYNFTSIKTMILQLRLEKLFTY